MASISIKQFGGASPRTGKRLLHENGAKAVINSKLFSGELRPWRRSKVVQELETATPPKTLYRMAGAFWMVFDDDVDIVRGPLPGDTDERSYLSGLGKPKVTTKTFIARARAGGAMIDTVMLGVPAPKSAPAAVVMRGSGGVNSRSYLYTYVNAFGEEGPPSPPSQVLDTEDTASVLLSGLENPEGAAAGESPDIRRRRIYRTVTNSQGESLWLLVDEIGIEQSSFVDNATDDELGGALLSGEFYPPPGDLQGLSILPSGVLAGFRGNEICFSEPLYPHAWPLRYRLVTEDPIQAIGVYGNSVVAATTSSPYLITGSDPAAMSMSRIASVQPCMSKRGLVSTQFGVVYPSPDGLFAVGPGGSDLLTKALFTRDEWLALNPAGMHTAVHNGRFFVFYENEQGPGAFVLDLAKTSADLTFLDASSAACFTEDASDTLFLVEKKDEAYAVTEWEGADEAATYDWTSKTFTTRSPVNMAAAVVQAEYETAMSDAEIAAYESERQSVLTANTASISAGGDPRGALGGHAVGAFSVNGDDLGRVPAAYIPPKGVTFRVYADGKERFVKEALSAAPFRLPGGYRAVEWELRLTGSVPLQEVAVAETLEELGNRR
jgi:hypothetical protein